MNRDVDKALLNTHRPKRHDMVTPGALDKLNVSRFIYFHPLSNMTYPSERPIIGTNDGH
jgi:hypothetical protein